MPVIVIALHDKKVLIATGAGWLMNGKSTSEKAAIAEAQRSDAATEAAAEREIHARLPKNCMMKPVVWKERDGYYTTKFVDKSSPNPPGFIKGTFPDREYPGEKPKDAAAREFEEETFTKFPVGRFSEVSFGTQVYKITLTDSEAQSVIANWKRHYSKDVGELIDLKWVPIADVLDNREDYNPQSREVFSRLEKYKGGGRVFSGGESKMATTRSMTRRKTRRAKSHCVGIKRSAVCKRTQGCKQAAGPKRRFCRTAKNRKHSK